MPVFVLIFKLAVFQFVLLPVTEIRVFLNFGKQVNCVWFKYETKCTNLQAAPITFKIVPQCGHWAKSSSSRLTDMLRATGQSEHLTG